MLRVLSIKNFILVKNLEIEFPESGFFALTGETGAGKSILIGALSLLLGERAEGKVVRKGSERAEVTAEFDINGLVNVQAILEENGLFERDVCLLRRTFDNTGRSRAWINGSPSTIGQLRKVGERLVNIYGQHDHQLLLQSSEQRILLDSYVGTLALADEVQIKWEKWQEVKKQREEAEGSRESLEKKAEYLRWQTDEIRGVKSLLADWGGLQREHKRLSNTASLNECIAEVLHNLFQADSAVISRVAHVKKIVENTLPSDAGLQSLFDGLVAVEIQLEETLLEAKEYAKTLDLDPKKLTDLEASLDQILLLANKHKCAPDDLVALSLNMEAELAALSPSINYEELSQLELDTKTEYISSAEELSRLRASGAGQLEKTITEMLHSLAMTEKLFIIKLTPLTDGMTSSFGLETVTFCLDSKTTDQPQAISRVASGGELSRISLAIQVAMVGLASVPTMVFDEVDSGIGGGVAEIVGRMLQGLGNNRQVMCVTHLAQVAAAAKGQWRVVKFDKDEENITTSAERLDDSGRVNELARMLGGLQITETTLMHASEMLTVSRLQERPDESS